MLRIHRLANVMQCDAAIVLSPVNRRYLTGFSSSAGILLLTKEEPYLLVDARYIQAAGEQVPHCRVVLQEADLSTQIGAVLKRHRAKTVAMETDSITVEQALRCHEWVKPAQLLWDSDFNGHLLSMRCHKEAEELECLREAQRITDTAFAELLNHVRPGRSELELMMVFGEHAARLGCEKRSFNMIFTSGDRTALPHGDPAIRQVRSGHLVMMDVGAMVGGYAADMTRTFGVGHATEKQREVYATVLAAQEQALAAIGPGAPCNLVDKAARDRIDASPYAGTFGHGLGHSLGLEIHENPRFNQTCSTKLELGMVMTVEPGIYLPGEFGVRIEDMVAITEEGYENFTKTPKELLVL